MKTKKTIIPVFLVAAMLATSITACGNKDASSGTKTESGSKVEAGSKVTAQKFPAFKGKDFDGNDVDESIFSKNEATLVNFWFNGCSACVNEMPALEKFSKKLKEQGAELVGINAGTASDEKGLAEAKDILSKQGVTYRNLILPNDHEYVRNKIFAENSDTWNKLFSKIKKDEAEKNASKPYAEFLQEQFEAAKADFTEEESKVIKEGLTKIAEIEKKIEELRKK